MDRPEDKTVADGVLGINPRPADDDGRGLYIHLQRSADITTAVGADLDRIAALYGIRRESATEESK